MKMLTAAIVNKLNKTKCDPDARTSEVLVKYFCPWANWTWYVLEGEQVGDDWEFFGYVDGIEGELGYFRLSELTSVSGPMGMKIEREYDFTALIDKYTGELQAA